MRRRSRSVLHKPTKRSQAVNSRRTGVVALSAVSVLTVAGCGVGVHFADYRHSVTPPDTRISDPVNDIVVNSGDGHLRVTAGGTGVTIHRVIRYQHGTPHPGQHLTDGTLTFTNGCSRCRIDYDLTVPASVRVRASSDSGRVEVAGVKSVDANTDSGALTVRQVGGDVSARSDSGSVTVEDVGGTLGVSTDSGAIRTTGLRSASVRTSSDSGSTRLNFAVQPGNVRATTDSGSLRLTVPGGTYDVDARNDSGGKDIRVDTSPRASAKIYLRSDSGHMSVLPV
jgi:Putative adhesin